MTRFVEKGHSPGFKPGESLTIFNLSALNRFMTGQPFLVAVHLQEGHEA